MNVAIIPARKNSKRIPHKNIKEFCGKPMLSYAINTAKEAKIFDEIIISTDCTKTCKIAESFGIKVPKLREKYNDDFASTIDVLAYEAKRLGLKNDDCICCIYPCVPLLQSKFLKDGFDVFLNNQKSYIFSACEYSANPLRSFFVKNNKIQMLAQNFVESRSQDLDKLYYDAGQFYFGSAENFLTKKPIFSKDSMIILIPQIFVIDINTTQDWEIAELKYHILKHKNTKNSDECFNLAHNL